MVQDCSATGAVTGQFHYIGGLIGYIKCGTVETSYSTGAVVSSEGERIGGLIGVLYDGMLLDSYATGSVMGVDKVGGLVGMSSGVIETCYAFGDVTATNSMAGGLVGRMNSDSYLSGTSRLYDSYAAGTVTGPSWVGGAVGRVDDGEVVGVLWDTQTSGLADGVGDVDPDPAGVSGHPTAEMMQQATFTAAGWAFVGELPGSADISWRMCRDGVDYPRLVWESPAADWLCPDGVDWSDFMYLYRYWGRDDCQYYWGCYGCDLNNDGSINMAELTVLAAHWLE